jgi:CIC family chloride channel protein
MGALAVAIVGGPFTMSFLVLETTGDFGLTAATLTASIIASLIVRETFGYSFSTWRLHLRGEDIAGAHDVGWVRTILVAGLMTPQPRTMPAQSSLAAFRLAHPLGGSHYVALIDPQNRYRGVVATAEAHAVGAEDQPLADLARLADVTLSPNQNIREALDAFERSGSEILVVVDGDGAVVGTLGEAYAARRYAAAVDRAAKGVLGGG